MFANTVSSGLCIAIHQLQTHLCNLWGNLSEERWAAESPPRCLAGLDEISKHTQQCGKALQPCYNKHTKGAGHSKKLRERFRWDFSGDVEQMILVLVNLRKCLKSCDIWHQDKCFWFTSQPLLYQQQQSNVNPAALYLLLNSFAGYKIHSWPIIKGWLLLRKFVYSVILTELLRNLIKKWSVSLWLCALCQSITERNHQTETRW